MSSQVPNQINAQLGVMRWLRIASIVLFSSCFLVGAAAFILREAMPQLGATVWNSALFKVLWDLLFAGAFVSMFANWAFGASKCPRCGKPFTRRAYSYNTLTSSCLHCGLKLDGSNSGEF